MPRISRRTTEENSHKFREKKLDQISVPDDDNRNYMKGFDMTVRQFTVSKFRQMCKRGELDFNVDMQRGEVWNKSRASLYIHSLLLGLSPYQSPFLMNKRTDENGKVIYEVLDGKQRGLPAIINYLNNEYALCGLANEPSIMYNGKPYNINGLRFCQLPEEIRGELESVSIPVAVSNDATPRQKTLIFSRANNYKGMSKFDLARARKEDMSDIISLSHHELFENMFKRKKLQTLDFQKLIVQSWILENDEKPNITSSHINVVMSTLSMSEEEQARLTRDYDRILRAYKILLPDEPSVAKDMLLATNFLMYLSFVENFPSDNALAEWLKTFFRNVPEKYKSISTDKTDSTTRVKTRMDIVENSINEFLTNYTEPKDQEDEQMRLDERNG